MRERKEIVKAPGEAKDLRLDKFLHSALAGVSRSKLSTLIEEGEVLVEGEQKKPSFRLRGGETIEVLFREEKVLLKPFALTVKIIYEDDDILVVDKPGGLVVHPPQPGYEKTLVNALLFMHKQLSQIHPLRPGVVHRLDKETSGVMVLAKHTQSHRALIEQFKGRKVEKDYRAISWGVVNKEKITVRLPLGRDTRNRLKMKISFVGAKQAVTEIFVLKRFLDATYFSLRPSTGRMHQIRVHLRFLGYPIVGDKKYGRKDGYDTLFLHAERIAFTHPLRKTRVCFESPLPQHFQQFMEQRECMR